MTGIKMRLPQRTITDYLVLLSLFLTITPDVAFGFGYAPNFITKIISSSRADSDPSLVDSDEISRVGDAAITTRFPPEPNGYLHLGHAKSISFNFGVAEMFGGKCNLRMDDTNPSKEDEEYVLSIENDVKWMRSSTTSKTDDEPTSTSPTPWDGPIRLTSDYFDFIHSCAVSLIESGDAYVDSLTADEMREYRGSLTSPGTDSPHRTRSVEENLRLFGEMKDGSHPNGAHVLRAKIRMDSPNLNLRDPTLYRIKHESHQATGSKWCMYPMYDFSHPISDAKEGITHSLCTLEFEDHRPFYDWVVGKLKERELIEMRPRQTEFSRLNLKYTVLSKRKLIRLVSENHVKGWDDPRLPTLSGIRRRGYSPESVRLFCERIGISKSDSNIAYEELENCVREVSDDHADRAFAVLDPVKVTITNWDGGLEAFEIPRHPKYEERGVRTVPFGKGVFIERDDFFDVENKDGDKVPKGFKRLLEGQKVRLKYAYVIQCNEVIRDPQTNQPTELLCTYFPETRAGVTPEGEKRTKGIIQWVEASTAVKCDVREYDRLFLTEEPGKDKDDFLQDINPNSLKIIDSAVCEPSVGMDALHLLAQIRHQSEDQNDALKKYASQLTFQFERNGYYALDPDSSPRKLVFNRVVTLRDTWAPPKKQPSSEEQPTRNRGNKNNAQKDAVLPDIQRIALQVGTVKSASPHPDAESLLVCQVSFGEEELRTVVAGLAGKISPEELTGRQIVALTNLKPSKMRGVESTAVMLAASNKEEGVDLVRPPGGCRDGELLRFEGMESPQPDGMLKSKGAIKVWDRVKACLRCNEEGEAVYVSEEGGKECRLLSEESDAVTSLFKNAPIR